MGINSGKTLKTGGQTPFIGPVAVKNAPKNFSNKEYKKAMTFDTDKDGVVDYEQLASNPFYKIEDYISNNATDEQILADIKAYRQKYGYSDSFFNKSDSVILDDIKQQINKSKKPTKKIEPVLSEEEKKSLAKENLIGIAKEYYLSKYDGTDYANANLSERWKIKNVPCTEEEKEALKQLENMLNEKEALKLALEDLNGEFNLAQKPIVNQGGSTGVGKDGSGRSLVILNAGNYFIYENASKTAVAEQTSDVESMRQLIKDTKRLYYIKNFENVDYDKNLDPNKRLNYRVEEYKYWDDKPGRGKQHTRTIAINDYIDSTTYEYMDKKQKQIYCYYLDKYGKDKADEYLFYIQEDVNEKIAQAQFDEIKSKLHLDDEEKLMEDLYNIGIVDNEGLKDGFIGFITNVCSSFLSEEIIGNRSAFDFKKLKILQYLSENSEYLEKRYEISEKIGRMIIPALSSFAVACSGGPTAGARLWAFLCGLDTAGEEVKGNAQKGYSGGLLYASSLFKGLNTATIKIIISKFLKTVFKGLDIANDTLKILTDCLSTILGKVGTDTLGELFDSLLKGRPYKVREVINECLDDTLKIAISSALVLGKGLIIKTNAGDIKLTAEQVKKVVYVDGSGEFMEVTVNLPDYPKELLQTLIRMGGNLKGDFKEVVEILVTSDD